MAEEQFECPACNHRFSYRLEPGQPLNGFCINCGLAIAWDGDCHVSWDGGVADRIKRSRGLLSIIDGVDHG